MTELNVALILKLVDRATAPARRAMETLERIGGRAVAEQARAIQRGSVIMADGLGTVAGRAALLGQRLATVQGALVAFGAFRLGQGFINTASQFERFNVQLTNLEGSQAGARKAMKWIEDFATKTPLEMADTVAAYARLRAFGIDPTNGSLQALVDTMAATGGDVETMNGLVLAFGQAWTKGKLQGEEAMQMLERGVPVWDILSKAMGKTTAEIMDMSSKGKLGRAEIQLLMDELGKRNFGAAEAMSQTWDGIISNIWDQWSRFQRLVMDSGLFQWMKSRLQELLAVLNAAAADGRLQAWAERTGHAVIKAFQALYDFGVGVYSAWQTVFPVLQKAADLLGGWNYLAMAAGAFLFAGSIKALVVGLFQLTRGAFFVGRALFYMMGPLLRMAWMLAGKLIVGAVLALEWAFFAAGRAALWLGRAFMIAGRFLLANPIIAVITAIAGLAYVIYQNWDGIVGYFQTKIDAVRAAFDQGLLNGVLKLLSEFNPFKLMTDSAVGLLAYLTGWDLTEVKDHLYDAFAINLFDKGVEMILSLWEGLKAKMGELKAWFAAQIDGIMPDWMKSSPDAGVGASTSGGVDPMGNPTLPGQELGGPVRAGRTYRVNERGVELFTPNRDGWIIPARRLAEGGRGGGGGGGGVSIGEMHIHAAPGMSAEQVAKHAVRELDRRSRDARFALNDGAAYG